MSRTCPWINYVLQFSSFSFNFGIAFCFDIKADSPFECDLECLQSGFLNGNIFFSLPVFSNFC
jgi:hypothetical protein